MNKKVFNIVKLVSIIVMASFLVILAKGNHDLKTSFNMYKSNGLHVSSIQYKTIDVTNNNKKLYTSKHNWVSNYRKKVVVTYKYKDNTDNGVVYLDRLLSPVETIDHTTNLNFCNIQTKNHDSIITSGKQDTTKQIYYATLNNY